MQHFAPLAPPFRVYVVDDHHFIAELLAQRLTADTAIDVVGMGNSGSQALAFVRTQRVDIVLLDMQLEDDNGVHVACELLACDPRLRVIGLSAHHDSHYPLSLLEAGARGFIAKRASTRELIEGVRRVARGDLAISPDVAYHLATGVRECGPRQRLQQLTPKETEVLRMLARGHAVAEIACALAISAKTVHSHRNAMRRKLKLGSDVELCLLALKAGLVHMHETR